MEIASVDGRACCAMKYVSRGTAGCFVREGEYHRAMTVIYEISHTNCDIYPVKTTKGLIHLVVLNTGPRLLLPLPVRKSLKTPWKNLKHTELLYGDRITRSIRRNNQHTGASPKNLHGGHWTPQNQEKAQRSPQAARWQADRGPILSAKLLHARVGCAALVFIFDFYYASLVACFQCSSV